MGESEELKEVFYGGFSYEEAQNFKRGRCYLCKREEQSESVAIIDYKPLVMELELKSVVFRNPNNQYRFPICEECILLLGAFADTKASEMVIE